MAITKRQSKINRKERNRKFIYNYLLQNPCVDCGEVDPRVLEFDHVEAKTANISELLCSVVSIEKLVNEISKCEVRCANCHRRKTSIQQNWFSHRYLLEEGQK